MSDSLITRVETMIATIEYAQFHRTSPAYPDAVVKATIRELLAALESARSYKSLPVGMVWQDYYSPDDVLKIRQPLDDEIEQLRAGGPWVEHVETIRALQESRHGGCICDCNPGTTNGAEEYCSHHGRPYYEAVDLLTAEIDRLVQQRREFTDRLGYGDGVTEPAAELADLVDPIKEAFSEAREHNECPRLCEPCGERLASMLCPECRGSGCHAAMCEASGAYRECEYCAGVGWVHEGCAEQSYADLVTSVGKLSAEIQSIRNIAAHTAIGGWEIALLAILDIIERTEQP